MRARVPRSVFGEWQPFEINAGEDQALLLAAVVALESLTD